VEGGLDVLSSFPEEILKGTALIEAQIKMIRQYVQKFMFCLDDDPTGTAIQKRLIQMIET
jgi:DNA primase